MMQGIQTCTDIAIRFLNQIEKCAVMNFDSLFSANLLQPALQAPRVRGGDLGEMRINNLYY
jgi:hypothetical protein